MSSTSKTENLGLSQWTGTDAIEMADFNADFQKIDAAAAYLPVKLTDYTVEEETQSITLDLSDKDIDQFGEIIIYADIKQEKRVHVNGVETEAYTVVSGTGSGSMEYLHLNPGVSRMAVTRKRFTYETDYSIAKYAMDRTKFPSLEALVIYGTDSNVFSADDRISIWGIRR